MEIVPDYNLTPEMVWAMMQENASQMAEFKNALRASSEKFDREMQDSRAKFDREMAELRQAQAERDAKSEREWAAIKQAQAERDAAYERQKAESEAKFKREWAAIKQAQAERDAAYEKQKAERDAKYAREQAETTRQLRIMSKSISDLNRAFGRSIERITTPDLQKKFKAIGYDFGFPMRNIIFRDERKEMIAEVDVLMENHEYAMAVEVKNNLQNDDIYDHLERLGILRKYADSKGDRRKYLGAMAAPDIDNSTMKAICKAGFFVVRMSDKAVDIITTENFKPREW